MGTERQTRKRLESHCDLTLTIEITHVPGRFSKGAAQETKKLDGISVDIRLAR